MSTNKLQNTLFLYSNDLQCKKRYNKGSRVTMNKNFGSYLEELRGKMSLREAAKKSGISHTYIRDLELGKKTDPSKDTILKLANAYGVRYDDLVFKIYNTKLFEDVLLNRTENEDHSEEYEKATHLMNLYFNSVIKWSEDQRFNENDTIILREHFYDLLFRYKQIVEKFANVKSSWESSKESFSKLYEDRLSNEEIRELFLKNELERELQSASDWIIAFPNWVARNEKS